MGNPSGGSHLPVLKKVLDQNTKPVLELGAGWYSTPFLYWDCLDKGISFTSYETDKEWVEALDGMSTWIDNYRDAPIDQEWGVVFIDHAPAERRVVDVLRLKDKADYIVLHDTESRKLYLLDQLDGQFPFQYTYKKHRPYTTVLSNKPFTL